MPFPNEHSLRLQSPDMTHIRVTRTSGSKGEKVVQGVAIPQTIDVIWFIVKRDGKEITIPQALRFPTKTFSAEQARKWIEDNKIRGRFEAASAEASDDNIAVVNFETLTDVMALDYKLSEDSKINDWIEIAKTGKFPQGNLTTTIFDEIVSTFNPDVHEPPHTLGHIRSGHNDKPAFAWVAALKRVGNTLLAKSKQVSAKLDTFVREGAFKKRSIGLRVNKAGKLYLHHLAWLGSATPAVEGMSNVYSFSDEGAEKETDHEFEHESDNLSNLKKRSSNMPREYTEAEIEALKNQAKADGKTEAEQNFESTVKPDLEKKAEEKGKAAAKKEFDEGEADRQATADYQRDCDALIKEFSEKDKDGNDPKINPAQVAVLRPLLYSFKKPVDVEYTEKDKDGKEKKIKTNALDLVRDFLKNYGAAPESTIPDTKDGPKGDEAQYEKEKAEAEKIQKEFSDKGSTITFGQALIRARAKLGVNKQK